MADDADEPRGETRAVGWFSGVLAQAAQVLFAQCLAHVREDIHDVVVVFREVPDRGEDQTAIPLEEEVPRGVEIACFELLD
jgi:hypothetical protein